MPLNRLGLFFKQEFDGGYRYLDRCGEFLVQAQARFGMSPSGNTTPQGGSLEAPDLGIKVETNAMVLRVVQELPGTDVECFRRFSEGLAKLYWDLFEPLSLERNSVAIQSYVPFNNYAKAEALTLAWSSHWGDNSFDGLSKAIGMTPAGGNVDRVFRSGSKEFHIRFRPITFENVGFSHRTAAGFASSRAIEKASRQNKGMDRIKNLELSHAALFELELLENAPPPGTFSAIFNEVLEKDAVLSKRWSNS
jgi:hypothetical protein